LVAASTAYSVEESRFTFSANVTNFTLHDSNLPQYRAAHVDGLASGVMCSYFAPNGISSCGNPYLLNELIRKEWGRPDAVVMSDCSAVGNMRKNVMKLNDTQASAQAMNAGMDIYGGWGDNLWVRPTLCVQVSVRFASHTMRASQCRLEHFRIWISNAAGSRRPSHSSDRGLDRRGNDHSLDTSYIDAKDESRTF
jgi:hypothetical protein